MIKVDNGQCGMCLHFGEHATADRDLVQIRVKGEAPETFKAECGHPEHEPLRLLVTANSSCAGYEPARRAG